MRVVIRQPCFDVDDERARIQIQRPLAFNNGIFLTTHETEKLSIPMMSNRIVGIQLDSSLKLRFCSAPVPVITELHVRERGMRLGEIVIQSERLLGRRARLRKNSAGSDIADHAE